MVYESVMDRAAGVAVVHGQRSSPDPPAKPTSGWSAPFAHDAMASLQRPFANH